MIKKQKIGYKQQLIKDVLGIILSRKPLLSYVLSYKQNKRDVNTVARVVDRKDLFLQTVIGFGRSRFDLFDPVSSDARVAEFVADITLRRFHVERLKKDPTLTKVEGIESAVLKQHMKNHANVAMPSTTTALRRIWHPVHNGEVLYHIVAYEMYGSHGSTNPYRVEIYDYKAVASDAWQYAKEADRDNRVNMELKHWARRSSEREACQHSTKEN